MTMSKQSRELMVETYETERRKQPGVGRFSVSKDDLLAALGFKNGDEFNITGVSWRQDALHIDLVSHDIHWQGGAIVSVYPVTTDAQANGTAED